MKKLFTGKKTYSLEHLVRHENTLYQVEENNEINEQIQGSPLKEIAFKAIVILPSLLLKKPSKKSKSKDHQKALERFIELWASGELLDLLKEAETIHNNLKSISGCSNTAEIFKKFSKEMKKGNCNNPSKILTDNE